MQLTAHAVLIMAFAGVDAVSAAALTAAQTHMLGVTSSGNVCVAGRNEYGELGDGTATDRWTPVTAVALSNISAVATGVR